MSKSAAEKATQQFQAGFQDNMEKMMSSFGEMNTFAKANVDAMVESMTRAGKGMEKLNSHVLSYSKAAMEDGVTTAKKMAGVKSVQELIELNTTYAKSALENHMSELSKIGEVYAETLKDSFAPLNDRATAAMEKVKVKA